MLNENIESELFLDINPEVTALMDKLGYKITVENGYKHYDWSLLRKTPFSNTLKEFITYSRIASGVAESVNDAYYFALQGIPEANDPLILYTLLFPTLAEEKE